MDRMYWTQSEGLSLRDQLAMQAMAILLGQDTCDCLPAGKIAAMAYELADAMIAERDKP